MTLTRWVAVRARACGKALIAKKVVRGVIIIRNIRAMTGAPPPPL